MLFIRHTRWPLRLNDLRDGNQRDATDGGAKPDGIWFSVGDGTDWRALVSRRWSLDDIEYWTEMIFSETANILRVENAAALDALTAKYAQARNDGKQSIDWCRIAEQFAGIIISPLCVERCNYEPTRWYECWEVACGCVWQAKAVRCLHALNY
jgi:hypothetical protein